MNISVFPKYIFWAWQESADLPEEVIAEQYLLDIPENSIRDHLHPKERITKDEMSMLSETPTGMIKPLHASSILSMLN